MGRIAIATIIVIVGVIAWAELAECGYCGGTCMNSGQCVLECSCIKKGPYSKGRCVSIK